MNIREQIGTTPRKRLTDRQRLSLFEAFGGLCALCNHKLGDPKDPWIDEHLRALGLGGTNQWDNRGPVHVRCAEVKTKDDNARIHKAKDQKIRDVGARGPKAKIASAPKAPKSTAKVDAIRALRERQFERTQ